MRMYLTNTGPTPEPGTRARLTGTWICCSTGPGACAEVIAGSARQTDATAASTASERCIFSSRETGTSVRLVLMIVEPRCAAIPSIGYAGGREPNLSRVCYEER